ncbi:MAG: hypothetical protein AAGA91_18945, partial [Pseudomonadota bacterium]
MKQPRCDAPAPFRILKPIFTTNTKPKFPPLVIAVAVASSALFNPLESSAQESSTTQHKLETLVVSATRLGQDYTETGSSVSVITSEDIRA